MYWIRSNQKFYHSYKRPKVTATTCKQWTKYQHWWMRCAHTNDILFNLERLCTETKTQHFLFRQLLFTEDAVFISHSERNGLESLMDRFAAVARPFSGHSVCKDKKCCNTPVDVHWHVHIDIIVNCTRPEKVSHFCYLGAFMSNDCSLEKIRTSKSCFNFSENKRLWSST